MSRLHRLAAKVMLFAGLVTLLLAPQTATANPIPADPSWCCPCSRFHSSDSGQTRLAACSARVTQAQNLKRGEHSHVAPSSSLTKGNAVRRARHPPSRPPDSHRESHPRRPLLVLPLSLLRRFLGLSSRVRLWLLVHQSYGR